MSGVPIGGAELVPVDELPPAGHQNKAAPISQQAIRGYLAAFPGQWFRVDCDHNSPYVMASQMSAQPNYEACIRGGTIFARHVGGGS